jgi:hypothetical protein
MALADKSDADLYWLLDSPDATTELKQAVQQILEQRKGEMLYINRESSPVSVGERAAISASTSPDETLEMLRNRYDDAQQLPDGAFVVKQGDNWHAVNPTGMDVGDIGPLLRAVPETLGAGVGFAAGSGAGPVGMVGGASTGATIGGNLWDMGLRSFYGLGDTRGGGQVAQDFGTDLLLNTLTTGLPESAVRGARSYVARAAGNDAPLRASVFSRNDIDPTASVLFPGLGTTEQAAMASPITYGLRAGVNPIDRTADDIAESVQRQLSNITEMGTPQELGEFVVERITKQVDSFKNQSEELYQKANRIVKGDERFNINNFRDEVNRQHNRYEADPEYTDVLVPPIIKKFHKVVNEGDGSVAYSTLNALRRDVGKALSDPNSTLVRDMDEADLNALYAMLNTDLKQGAEVIGGDAKTAIFDAVNYYSGGRDQIEGFEKLIRNRNPEQVGNFLANSARQGGSNLNVLSGLLTPGEMDQFGAGARSSPRPKESCSKVMLVGLRPIPS